MRPGGDAAVSAKKKARRKGAAAAANKEEQQEQHHERGGTSNGSSKHVKKRSLGQAVSFSHANGSLPLDGSTSGSDDDPQQQDMLPTTDDEEQQLEEGGGLSLEDLDDEQRERVVREAGQLRQVLDDFDGKAQELQQKVQGLTQRLHQERDARVSDGVSYLVAKQQILLTYCLNLCVYLGVKLRGGSVARHAATWQLLELRGVLERLRPLDARLKHQLDKLFRAAAAPVTEHPDAAAEVEAEAAAAAAAADPLSFRPNPDALLSKDGLGGEFQVEDEDEDETAGFRPSGGDRRAAAMAAAAAVQQRRRRSSGADVDVDGGGGVYRAPRLAAVPYDEETGAAAKDEKRAARRRDRARRGEILDALRSEFGDRPEVMRVDGGAGAAVDEGARRKIDREERERLEFEEDHMIRLQRTKKMKRERRQKLQAASRLDTIADVGNVGDLMRLGDFEGGASSGGRRSAGPKIGSKRAVGGALGMAVGSVGSRGKRHRGR